jgi:hypothetical protein
MHIQWFKKFLYSLTTFQHVSVMATTIISPPPSNKHCYFKLFMQVDFSDDEALKTLRRQLCFFFIMCKNKVMSLVKPQSTITCGLLVITVTYFRNILVISENCKILLHFCLPHLLLHTPIILRNLLHSYHS